MTKEVTTANFTDILKEKNITVIDFWAPWCGPCKMLLPVIDELSVDNEGKDVTIAKINVDEYGEIAQQLGVRGVPTVMFFKDGVEVKENRIVGYKPKSEFQKVIEGML